jgi:hypothetical protein
MESAEQFVDGAGFGRVEAVSRDAFPLNPNGTGIAGFKMERAMARHLRWVCLRHPSHHPCGGPERRAICQIASLLGEAKAVASWENPDEP